MIEMLTIKEGAMARLIRGRQLIEDIALVRPNEVFASVWHEREQQWEHCGISQNLRTNVGIDWEANVLGGVLGTTSGSPATAASGTSLTATGTPYTSDQYKGWRVVAVNGSSQPTVGNIGTNTSSVLTIDAWSNSNAGSTSAYVILPGQGPARYIGIDTSGTSPVGGDTALPTEETANALNRALATYAHTGGVTSYTQSNTFTYTGSTSKTIAKAGTFTASTLTAGGIMVFETLLNSTATVNANGDAIALTWTVNI